jgi:hypothetical protein
MNSFNKSSVSWDELAQNAAKEVSREKKILEASSATKTFTMPKPTTPRKPSTSPQRTWWLPPKPDWGKL